MATIDEWKQRDQDFQSDYNDLQTRMKDDLDIYRLVTVNQIKDENGDPIEDIVQETTSMPLVFGDNLMADIGEGEVQWTIEDIDKLSDNEKANIVKWIEVMLQAVDEYLLLRGDPPLFLSIVSQLSLRGRTLVLPYPHVKDGLIVPHILPWDSAFSDFLPALSGQGWGIYQMTRAASKVRADYPDITIAPDKKGIINVWDCWDFESHDVILDGSDMTSEAHGLGFCPVIQEIVQNSPFVRDVDYKKYEGESIYSPTRKVWPRLNFYLTIESSLTMRSFQNGMQLKTKDGAQAIVDGDPSGNRKINKLGIDEGFYPMPLEDLKQSTMMGHQAAEKEVSMGTLPLLELGQINAQNTLPQITQSNDVTKKKESPIIKAAERTLERICQMAIRIAVKQDWKNTREFIPDINLELPAAKIDSKFRIKCQITPVVPLENVARTQQAILLERFLSDHEIIENILKYKNADAVMAEKNEEVVEDKSPRLATWKAAVRNLQSKDKEQQAEGALLSFELGLSPEQVKAGEVPQQQQVTPTPGAQQVGGAPPSVPTMAGLQQGMATRAANTAAKVTGG